MNQGVTAEEFDELRNITAEMQLHRMSSVYDLNKLTETVEIENIHFALKVHNGNRTRAAEMLGLKRTCLVAKMRKYDIT